MFKPRELHLAGKTMGTTWHATIIAPSSTPSEDAIQSALQRRLDELDTAFTNWRGDCPVTRFNASRSTEWQSEPRELVELVLFGRQLSELTGGAFDVTVSPLVDLRGFGPKGRVKEPPPDSGNPQGLCRMLDGKNWKPASTRRRFANQTRSWRSMYPPWQMAMQWMNLRRCCAAWVSTTS